MRKNYIYRVVILLFLLITCLSLSYFEAFKFFDSYLFDHTITLVPEINQDKTNILLIEVPRDYLHFNKAWPALIDLLNQNQAKLIVFTIIPASASTQFYSSVITSDRVIIGRNLLSDPDSESEQEDLKSLTPPIPEGLSLQPNYHWGIIDVPDPINGVYRYQSNYSYFNDNPIKSIEFIVKERTSTKTTTTLPPPTFMVNFGGLSHGLPKINLQRILKEKSLPEIIKGKIVLIGRQLDTKTENIITPITKNGPRMSLLDFHGYALNTLLAKNEIGDLSALFKIFIHLAIFIIGFIIFQFVNVRMSILLNALIIGSYIVVFVLSSVFLDLWVPLTEVIFSQSVIFLYIYFNKVIRDNLTAHRMLIDLSLKLKQRLFPQNFHSSPEYWDQIITMMSQTLHLNKAIFLDRISHDHRVKEVKSFNCSVDDINEKRRDYTRTPYSTAIEEKGIIQIEKVRFFKHTKHNELEFLVPLTFTGQVLGFLAYTIDSDQLEKTPRFTSIMKNFTTQVGEMLYIRHQWQLQQISDDSSLKKYLRMEGDAFAYKKLNESLKILEQRLSLTEEVLNELDTAIILYDLFGRVLYVNEKMHSLCRVSGLNPEDSNALDLGVALSMKDRTMFQGFLQNVILNRNTISLSVHLPSAPENQYALNIRALTHDPNNLNMFDKKPFQITGILFELIDITNVKKLMNAKIRLFDVHHYKLRRSLEIVMLGSAILEQYKKIHKDHEKIFEMIDGSVDEIEDSLKEIRSQLKQDIFPSDVDHFIINPKDMIEEVVPQVSKDALAKKVAIEVNLPDEENFVFASLFFESVVHLFLKILINDALKDSKIKISTFQIAGKSGYRFSNHGSGMDQSLLDEYINTPSEDSEEDTVEYRKLYAVAKQIIKWGGKLEATSEVGVGIQFDIYLRAVLLDHTQEEITAI